MAGSDTVRPKSMLWFDRLFLGSVAVSLAGTIALLPEVQQMIDDGPLLAQTNVSVAAIVGQLAGMFFIILLLWFCVSRLRSRVARWIMTIFVLLFSLGVLLKGAALFDYGVVNAAFSIGNAVLSLLAVMCLFTSEARTWFFRR